MTSNPQPIQTSPNLFHKKSLPQDFYYQNQTLLAALGKALCPHTNCVCRAVVPMSRDHCSWLLGQLGIGCGSNQNPGHSVFIHKVKIMLIIYIFFCLFSMKRRNSCIFFMRFLFVISCYICFLRFHVMFFCYFMLCFGGLEVRHPRQLSCLNL